MNIYCATSIGEEESIEGLQSVIPMGGRGLSTMTRPTT